MIQRCHLYHRVSAADGDVDGSVLERLRRTARARRWIVEAEHVDRQERPSDARPAFKQLDAALRRGPAGLIAHNLHRLFPAPMPAALRRLAAWLRQGARIITIEPPLDTALPTSWERALDGLVELARRQRSEATAAGHALRRRAGLVERNVWNDREIKRRYRAGESQRTMARALGVAQSSFCVHLHDLRREGYLQGSDDDAHRAARSDNPASLGGRPKKAPAEATR